MPGSAKDVVSYNRLAAVLKVPVEKVFDLVPMPDTIQGVSQRRRKKKELGLDHTEEDLAMRTLQMELQLNKMREEIATEPPLTTEQIQKLASLAKEVFQ